MISKKSKFNLIFLFLIYFLINVIFYATNVSCAQNKVYLIQLDDDSINPVTAEYITRGIDKAYQNEAQCLIIKLDTPGGLLNSTRLIVKKMLTSKIPIVVYISPSGSRAGSAGVFITYASHIAAMAPSTNIGAAHPVQIGNENPKRAGDWDELKKMIEDLRDVKKKNLDNSQESAKESSKLKNKDESTNKSNSTQTQKSDEALPFDEHPMESKILQDTVAFIKAISKERNRNTEWAIESVTKSLSITNEEALQKQVVEIVAVDEKDLLKQLDGRSVQIEGKSVVLQTKDAIIENIPMDVRQKFFNILANPNIAYFLLILGFYGLLFEITHPGTAVPGILGGIFLILAFYSMQTLPTNYAGVALMILGLILLVAEVFTPGLGMLTLGGIVSMILGSMLLFDSVDPVMRVSKEAIIVFTLSTLGLTLFLLRSVVKTHRRKAISGQEGLIGEKAEVQTTIKPGHSGKIYLHGELWKAESDETIHPGEKVVVIKVEGLTVKVKKD